MWKRLFAAAGLATIVLPGAPLSASQDALAELAAQLPGTLVNDPSRLDWESYGSDLERSVVQDATIPGGVAIQFDIKRASEFIYTAGTNVPLTKTVRRGDQITVGFYARTIRAQTEDDRGVLRVRFQQNAEPFPGFGEQTLSIGRDWQWYEVTAEVEMTLRRKDGIVALQFGRTRQTIEIGQAIVVAGADRIVSSVTPESAAPEPQPVPEPTPIPVVKEEPLIPEPLKGAGELLNNPKGDGWQFLGTVGSVERRDDPDIWHGKSRRFTVESSQADPGALSLAVPISADISGGDSLLIAIAGRTEQAITSDRRAKVSIKIDDLDPARGDFAQAEFPLGEDWQLIRLRARSPRNYPAGSARLVLQFAGNAQVVDIGPVYVFRTQPSQ